uniref:Uncharacterized protein n=1 Tax=Arundo donax TaxID=35708 RepID=A0A0A9DZ27_ARUDO
MFVGVQLLKSLDHQALCRGNLQVVREGGGRLKAC